MYIKLAVHQISCISKYMLKRGVGPYLEVAVYNKVYEMPESERG